MKFIIDLDRTLFNTDKFVEDIIELAGGYEVEREQFMTAYKKASPKGLDSICFTPENLAEKLGLTEHQKEFESVIYDLLRKNKEKYLFPETAKFLEQLEKGGELILLTRGDKVFQESKIEILQLKDFFKEIYIDGRPKEESCKKWQGEEGQVVFINDDEKEMRSLREKFLKWQYIQLQWGKTRESIQKRGAPEYEYTDSHEGITICKNYQEVLAHIERLKS